MAVYSLIYMRITWDFSESFTDSCFTLVVFLLFFSTLLCHHTGILASQENQSTVFVVEQQILWSSHVHM